MTTPPVKPARRKSPGRFHHGDLAEQAAIEACRIVDEQGHVSLSMRAVAAAVGVTEPAIYRHYDGRDALLAEVAVRGFERFAAALGAKVAEATDPFDAVVRFSQTYVRFAAANRGWFRLTFSREITEGAYARRLMDGRLGGAEDARQGLLRLLARALPPGDSRNADLYRLVWGTAHGLAFLVVERVFQLVDTDEERIAAADDAIGLLVESLAARAEGGRSD